VLQGQSGPPRDIVIANSAAALWIVGRAPSLRQCAARAREAIDSGAAGDLLSRLVKRTNYKA
jgi:anthranilate phosphoribosyltransferase